MDFFGGPFGIQKAENAMADKCQKRKSAILMLERNPYEILIAFPNANPDEDHRAIFKHYERIHQFHNSRRAAQRGRSQTGLGNTRDDPRNISVRILWQRCFGMGSPPPARQR